MYQSLLSANIPPGNPRGFAKDPNPADRDLYKPKFPPGPGICSKKCTFPKLYLIIVLILLAILSRFVLVVDSMYRNRLRKIVVSTQIARDFCYLIKNTDT